MTKKSKRDRNLGRPTCIKCGKVHDRCTAHTRAGEPCRIDPMKNQTVCRIHGGSNPVALQAAARRDREHRMHQAVATLGLAVEISPEEALVEEIRWTAGHVRWLRSQIQDLDPKDLVWGKVQTVDRGSGEFPGLDHTYAAGMNPWYDLYLRERDHLVKVCAAAMKAGVEERKIQLAERQGMMLAEVIRRVLEALGLSADQWELVATVVPRELRALEAIQVVEG